jgi:hypothetical protein
VTYETPDASAIYSRSEHVATTEIAGVPVLVPFLLASDAAPSQLMLMNPAALATWRRIDGRRTLRAVIAELASDYDQSAADIEADVLSMVAELLHRQFLAVSP